MRHLDDEFAELDDGTDLRGNPRPCRDPQCANNPRATSYEAMDGFLCPSCEARADQISREAEPDQISGEGDPDQFQGESPRGGEA